MLLSSKPKTSDVVLVSKVADAGTGTDLFLIIFNCSLLVSDCSDVSPLLVVLVAVLCLLLGLLLVDSLDKSAKALTSAACLRTSCFRNRSTLSLVTTNSCENYHR